MICRNGECRVNVVAAALCFPEIFSCGSSFQHFQTTKSVLLPDHTLQEVQHILSLLLTAQQQVPTPPDVEVKYELDPPEAGDEQEEEDGKETMVLSGEDTEAEMEDVPVSRRRQQRRSRIWRFFTDVSTSGGVVSCVECGEEMAAPRSSTNAMSRHLQKLHPELHKRLVGRESSADVAGPDLPSPQPPASVVAAERAHWTCRYFSVEREGGEQQQHRCNLCHKRVKLPRAANTSGLVLHMEQQHWEEFSRFCLACEEPVEAGGEGEVACPDGGEGEVTCPDCGCRYHAACLPDTDLQSWCLYCRRNRGKSKKIKSKAANGGERGKQPDAALCPHCGKEFRYLAQHIKLSHMGLVRYAPAQCDICKKVYTQKSHLTQHVRAVHEQVKDHKCNFCGRAFFRKMHFKRHMETMHMDIHVYQHVTCGACGKQFKSRTAMYKHNRVVHLGIKPAGNLFCEECGQTFTQSGSLYAHMRKMHEKEPDIPKNRSNFCKDKVLVDTDRILECHPELRPDIVKAVVAANSL